MTDEHPDILFAHLPLMLTQIRKKHGTIRIVVGLRGATQVKFKKRDIRAASFPLAVVEAYRVALLDPETEIRPRKPK